MEPHSIKFVDPSGKSYTTTVVASDRETAKTIVQEMYPWAQVQN